MIFSHTGFASFQAVVFQLSLEILTSKSESENDLIGFIGDYSCRWMVLLTISILEWLEYRDYFGERQIDWCRLNYQS